MGLACFKSWKYDGASRKGENRDVPVSPGSYFFLSNSCGQGEEWLKTLNKGVWIPFTGVFGQRLEETVVYERRYGEHMAPLVVEQCVAFIRERGLQEVGLFRQPGQATLVKELQEAFDAGEKPSFDSSTDVHTVASLLKLYLRELPEPVVPFSRYQDFLLCAKHIPIDRKQGLLELKRLLHELPVANFNLLHYICQFLNEVQSYSSSNKMSTQNLATVFGPNILRPKAEDPESIIGGAAVVQQLMSELIRECGLLFVRESDAAAWPGSAPFPEEVRVDPVARPRRSCPAPGPAPGPADETGSAQSPPGHTAPRRQSETEPRLFQTPSPGSLVDPLYENLFLSRYRTPPPPPPPPPSTPPPPPPTAPGPAVPAAMAGRGLSGPRERRRGSDTQESTLSVYDNMGGARVGGGAREDGATSAGSSSSWSSCELLVEDSAPGGLPALRADPEEPRVNSPASSAFTEPPLSSGSSEVFLPSAPPAPHPAPNAMHCILAGLRQQMARQKLEFESRIRSLEQKNESLQAEVSGLRAALEQQRRWRGAAEVKMRNAERGRSDAERRNAALQREMEQFFHAFRELDGEADRVAQSS